MDSNSQQPPRDFLPLTSSVRAARGPCRRHGAAREPPPEGPRRPRHHPLRAGGLHQPPVLPHRGGQQPARPRREVPGAARLPGPAAQRARREGGGAQPGAAALLAGLRRAALPARREAPGAGGVPAAAPHDGDRRREAAPAATARAANRGCACGRLGRDRHRHRNRYRNRALTRPGREGPERPRTAPAWDLSGPGLLSPGAALARDCSGPRLHRPGVVLSRGCSGLPGPELSRPVGPIKALPLHSAPALCCFLLSVRARRCPVWCLEEALLNSPGVPLFPGALPAALPSSSCQSSDPWLCFTVTAGQRLRASLAHTDADTSAAGFLLTLQRGSGAVCSFKSKRERFQSPVTHCPSPSLQVLLFNPIFDPVPRDKKPTQVSPTLGGPLSFWGFLCTALK